MVDKRGSNPQAGRLLPQRTLCKDEAALATKNKEPQLFLESHRKRSSLWRASNYITELPNHKIRLIYPSTVRAIEKLSEQGCKATDHNETQSIQSLCSQLSFPSSKILICLLRTQEVGVRMKAAFKQRQQND